MAPRVVWAAQAPLLLNRLVSKAWRMEVAVLEDAGSLAEMDQFRAPVWDGRAEGVEYAFSCAPSHTRFFRERIPKAEIVGVAHQGYWQKLPDHDGRVVCFSTTNAKQLSHDGVENVCVLTPVYSYTPCWVWQEQQVWTMMARPNTREPISSAALESARRISKVPIQVFGQDQPAGHLTADAKQTLLRSCSAYFSALPPRAGFGLAEHEAMEVGCPVVGAVWGPLASCAFKGEPEHDPRWGMTDYGDIYGLACLAERAAEERAFASTVAQSQQAYIRLYTPELLHKNICYLLDR